MIVRRLPLLGILCVAAVAAVAAACADDGDGAGTTRPPALQRAIDARSKDRIKTARIEYVRHSFRTDARFGPHSYFYTWSTAGDERATTAWGDEEDVCVRNEKGEVATEYTSIGPQSSLLRGGELWQHRDDSLKADLFAKPENVRFLTDADQLFDLRRVGLDPHGRDRDLDEFIRAQGGGPLQYESHREGALDVVTATTEKGSTFIWWIDPAKGDSVVRTAVEANGERIGEIIYELEEFDGIWFPRRVEHRGGRGGSGKIFEVVEFTSVEFNRPEHPKSLGPADIGVEVGTNVGYQDKPAPLLIWDGAKGVGPEEFFARIAAGELARGPSVVRELRRQGHGDAVDREPGRLAAGKTGAAEVVESKAPARALGIGGAAARLCRQSESQWERYTRHIIQQFTLDPAQTERAAEILKECQVRAARFSAERKETFQELTARMRKDETRAKAAEQLSRELRELSVALDRIFEDQLKPRLDKLPTRAQRDAARLPSTSQPAGKP